MYFCSMYIQIPIKKHLLKYLISVLGCDTLELKKMNSFEAFLSKDNKVCAIQKKLSDCIFPLMQCHKGFEAKKYDLKKYQFISLKVTNKMFAMQRFYIDENGVNTINYLIKKIMMDELMDMVFEAIDDNKRLDLIILGFMAQHNIDEEQDIKFDSLKRNCFRERKKIIESFPDKHLPATSLVLNLSFAKTLIND